MAITTSTGLTSFDQKFYQSMASTAAVYYRESAKSAVIPVAYADKLDADEYKKPIFGASTGVYGESEYGVEGRKMETPKSTKTHGLAVVRCNIYYGPNELKQEGSFVLQSKQDKLKEWMRQADLSIWNGVYTDGYNALGTGQGSLLADGVLTNAGTVVNLDQAEASSAIDAAGDFYAALTKMIHSIPFRLREKFEIHLGMTSHFYILGNGPTFTNASGVTEFEKFYEKYVMKGVPGFKVSPNIVISDEIFGNLGDTLNTHDRLFAFVANPDVVERAYSRGISQLGQKQDVISGVEEAWATKLGGCVNDANGFLLSEQLTH